MSAFGLNRPTVNFAYAIKAAGGSRLTDKILKVVDLLVAELCGWCDGSTNFPLAFRVIYPLVGGNAIAHSFNLVDPSVARMTFVSVTHDAVNGITGNGTSSEGQMNIALEGTTPITYANISLGVYCRTASSTGSSEMSNGSPNSQHGIMCRDASGNAKFNSGSVVTTPTLVTTAVASSNGFFCNVRIGANLLRGFRNGAQVGSDQTTTINSMSSLNFKLLSDPTSGNYSARNLAFAFLSTSTNPVPFWSKPMELYTVIQNFQTRLGRQV